MIADKIKEAIYNAKFYEAASGGDGMPSVILIHPKTFDDFYHETAGLMILASGGAKKTPKYNGIRIIRSDDIKEGEVEAY